MLIKSVTILGLVALATAATVHQRNIPVEVRYDEPVAAESVRNFGDEVQVIPADVKEITAIKDAPEAPKESSAVEQTKLYGVRNLEEKVQLSPEDLGLALKHLPVQPDEDMAVAETIPLRTVNDTPQIEEITKQPDYIQSVLKQAEDIISSGLKRLRVSFKPAENQKVPDTEQWDNLEKAVNAYLTEEKTKLQLKQTQPPAPPTNQNFFQNLASGFQTIANNFVQNLSGGQTTAGNSTQGDEQPGGAAQGPFQGFINYFQGGVNNIANAINNLGNQGSTTSNTVLGDTGSTTQSPNFISSFVNNVQQFFGQLQGGSQTGGSAGTQGDPGVNNTVSGPQGPGQVIQTIGSAITNFIQGRPPNTPGDEGTATTQSSNIIQSIGNVIQNSPLNPFRPQQGQKPDEAAGGTTQNPIQSGISGIQNVGSQIQQLVGGQNTSSDDSKQPESQAAPVQNVQQPVSEQNSNEPDEKPQVEIGSNQNQVIEEGSSRQSFTVSEEVAAAVEEFNKNQQEVQNQVNQEANKQELPKEEVTSSLEEIKAETDSKEEAKQEESSQEVKQNTDQKEVAPVDSELEDPVPDYPRPQVLIPVTIRQPEPFHIELDQEEPIPVEIRQREPLYGDIKLEEFSQEESRPAAVKEQKEEILMTVE